MSYFMYVKGLSELEKQENWDRARDLLYKSWKSDTQSCEKLVRLMAECWYVLSLWDCSIKTENLCQKMFMDNLIECTHYGLSNSMDCHRFLCVGGYMISTLPHLFYNNDTGNSYTEWEKQGMTMLQKSRNLDSSDLIAKIFYLGFTTNLTEYDESKRLIQPHLEELFPKKTAIEEYFADILSIH